MDTRDVLRAVRARWAYLAAGLVLGLVAGWAWTSTSVPLYQSSTRLFVSAPMLTSVSPYEANLLPQQRVASYAELLTGEALAARVVDELQLRMTADELVEKVDVRFVPETVLLRVTVTDTSPERAQAIAASLDRQFVAQVAELETPSGALDAPITISVVEEPQVPSEAVSPDAPRALTVGAGLGLLAGFVLLLLAHRRDTTVRREADVRSAVGRELMGAVPEDPRLAGRGWAGGDAEGSVSDEAIRGIGAHVQFADDERPAQVVVIASAVAGEGRTTLAVNLAAALGQSGQRVLLLEADLRRPVMAQLLGLIGSGGLAAVLAGTTELRDAVRPMADGSPVSVLTAGPGSVAPAEFGSDRMREVLMAARGAYGFVVVDTPPLLAASEAAVIGMLADGCVLLARHGVTRREELAEAGTLLARLDARLLGVVLNGVPTAAARRAGYAFGPATTRSSTAARGPWSRGRRSASLPATPRTEAGTS